LPCGRLRIKRRTSKILFGGTRGVEPRPAAHCVFVNVQEAAVHCAPRLRYMLVLCAGCGRQMSTVRDEKEKAPLREVHSDAGSRTPTCCALRCASNTRSSHAPCTTSEIPACLVSSPYDEGLNTEEIARNNDYSDEPALLPVAHLSS
jgi:hypothetical protein